jgi:hypothetical protein
LGIFLKLTIMTSVKDAGPVRYKLLLAARDGHIDDVSRLVAYFANDVSMLLIALNHAGYKGHLLIVK